MSIHPALGALTVTLSLAAPAFAATITVDRNDPASRTGARGIAVADLNRDGWLDIATANHGPDGVEVLINRGAAGGYTPTFIPIAGGPFDIAAADLNRDGIPDLAVAAADANEIDVLFGQASGGFSALHISAPSNPRGLAIGDLDKDGNPDIVYTQFANQGVQVLYGDGNGHFAARRGADHVDVNPQGVAIADFNMDGWPDLVVASSGTVGLAILYQTPGAGTFTRTDLNVPTQQNVVTVADFNRDGRPDIAAASTASSAVTIFINAKSFTTTLVYSSGGGSTRGIAAIDLDRDGAPDVITGNRGSSTIDVLPGNGDGTFGTPYGFAAGSGSRAVAVGDFDNDGRIDIASGNEYDATATVLSNTTTFTKSAYAFARTLMGPQNSGYSSWNSADVADFDGDGKYDAVTIAASSGAVVLLASGSSTRLPTLVLGPRAIKATNLNSDGYPDLVLLDSGIGVDDRTRIESYLGDGTGQFPGRTMTQTALNADDMQLADVNRDGKIDAVLLGQSGGPETNAHVQVFLGNGDGTFTAGSDLLLPGAVASLIVGDVNRDGSPDLISTYNGGGGRGTTTLYTWINDGNGQFTSAPRALGLPQWDALNGGALGDLNHDGWLDLVIAGYPAGGDFSQHDMGVLLGSASGFSGPTFVDTGNLYSFPPHLADITLDGNLDLLTEEGGILPGNGDGTFGPVQAFAFYAPDMRVLDFNKDGLPDVFSKGADGSVQILENQHRDTNMTPTVDAGQDFSIQYRYQFGDGELEFWANGSDPDLHALSYKWYDEEGNLLADSGSFPYYTPHQLAPGSYTYTVIADDGRGATARDSITMTILPEKEVVIYGDQYSNAVGDKWSIAQDSTAAGGAAVHDRNDGTPKITSPSATPASYVDLEFVADPTQTYKLWVRLKAEGDSSANDSVWLQFSGAVDANGRAYEPGTTSGIEVVLEECSGCGDSGWGWRDEAWGAKGAIGTLTLHFPKGGSQHVRFQTREDGVYVDQVVLSSRQYRTTRPGAVKNDGTILPASRY
jgi:hypothetical protein